VKLPIVQFVDDVRALINGGKRERRLGAKLAPHYMSYKYFIISKGSIRSASPYYSGKHVSFFSVLFFCYLNRYFIVFCYKKKVIYNVHNKN
jgi:hypothetical protein